MNRGLRLAGRRLGRRRRRSSPGRSTSATATSQCSRRSSTACARGSTTSREIAGPGRLWDGAASSSGTGSIPTRRRTSRRRRKPTRSSSPPHTSPARREIVGRRRRSARATRRRRASTARSPRRSAPRSEHEYVTPNGRLLSDSPTAYALALEFDLLEPDDAARRAPSGWPSCVARGRLPHRHRLRRNAHRAADALDATAATIATAYRLLLQTECPSWLYPVTMGATTIWERWDSMLPDGSINPGEMTSFNHYALGSVADWMHRTIGGPEPRRARVSPASDRTRPRRGPDLRPRHPRHAVRPRIHLVGARRCAVHTRGDGAGQHDGSGGAPRARRTRGHRRFRFPPLDLSARPERPHCMEQPVNARPHDLRVDHLVAPARHRPRRGPESRGSFPPARRRSTRTGSWRTTGTRAGSSRRRRCSSPVDVTPRSGLAVEWKVKTWTDLGESDWSEPSSWEHGLLDAADWTRAVDRADRRRRPPGAGSDPPTNSPAPSAIDGEIAPRPPVRDRPRRLRGVRQRHAGRRHRAHARVDRVPHAPPGADLRRHRPPRRPATTSSARSLSDGWWRGPEQRGAPGRRLRHHDRAPRCSSS